MFYIKLKGIPNTARLLQIFCPHSPRPPLGMGSIGRKSTFSEHGHVAHLIKRNHEMQQHGHNMVETLQVSLFLLNYSLKTS